LHASNKVAIGADVIQSCLKGKVLQVGPKVFSFLQAALS
jgi:hypothetical protein